MAFIAFSPRWNSGLAIAERSSLLFITSFGRRQESVAVQRLHNDGVQFKGGFQILPLGAARPGYPGYRR
jgi:hypothetical protein